MQTHLLQEQMIIPIKGFAHFKYMISGPKNILALTGSTDRPHENNIPKLDVSHDIYDNIVPFGSCKTPESTHS